MSPSAIRSSLRLLGLCAALLLLAAAVTVSVAVLVWNSDAAHQWRACRAQARNHTVRLAELEGETQILRKRLEEELKKEEDLRHQLYQANRGLRQLNGTLANCHNHADMLRENVTALKNATTAIRMECSEAEARNDVLQVDLAQWQGQARGLQRELEGVQQQFHNATQNQRDAEDQREDCRGQNAQLQVTVRDYKAVIDQLRRQLRSGAPGHRPHPWQRLWATVSGCSILLMMERLHS